MSSEAPAPSTRQWAGALRGRLTDLLASRTLRSLGVLVGGTATAHSITALVMPVSTRLYSPEDFSAAAVFAGIVAILSVAACLRLDLAIALPDSDEEAADLLVLSVLCALGAAAITGGVLAVLPPAWLTLLGEPAVLPWLWLVPVGVLAGGVYLALQMWFVRRGGFRAIASSRIAQSAGAASAQIGLGIARQAPLGLIMGQLLNFGAGALWLGTSMLLRDHRLLRQVTVRRMRRAFAKHRRFPLYSTWEALANAASIQAPILLIASLASGPEPGYLTLAIFLLQMPMALLGNAIGQVYLAGAPKAFEQGRLAAYTLDTLRGLVRAAVIPMAMLAIISPAAFGLVFGHPWTRAGILVAWMVPWFFAQFITSPISTVLHVTGRQSSAMALQVGGLGLRLGGVIAAAALVPAMISETYAVTGFLFYAVYFAVVGRAIGLSWVDFARLLREGLPLAGAGVCAGTLVAVALSFLRIG
jgi:O-antigen/teichoic acid export membrane protein